MFHARSEKKAPVTISQDNRIVVLVWLPKKEGKVTTASDVLDAIAEARKAGQHANVNIGHVALATQTSYVSLWPAESLGGQRFKVVNAAYSNIETDIQSESGPPDVLVTLYSLDTTAIDSAFEEIQEKDRGFVLAGDKSLVRVANDREGNNCNGLVYELLQRGGVGKIEPFDTSSQFSLYISPDKFNTYIQGVKDEEFRKYPETKAFPLLDGEYQPKSQTSIFSKLD